MKLSCGAGHAGSNSLENRALLSDIRCAHAESGGCYGAPRVHAVLRAAGRCVGRHRIARLTRLFDEQEVKLRRMLTDRCAEYRGNPERHECELYLAVEDIDHSRTKTKSPQTNGIVERFHKTVLDGFCRAAFRKKVYREIDELQDVLDAWLRTCNEERERQGRWRLGETPIRTFLDAAPIAKAKMIAA